MVMKVLLASLTTTRDGARVTFDPKKGPVDLTADEIKTFDNLTEATGKRYYRDPINEGGDKLEPQAGSADLTGEEMDAYEGVGVPMEEKTAAQLAAYLDHKGIAYPPRAAKPALLALATGGGDNGSPQQAPSVNQAESPGPAGSGEERDDKDAGL